MCGWSIDFIAWFQLRPMMKGKFGGLMYSMATSDSPVIVYHREKLSDKEMIKYAKLFPKNIRVEYQEITEPGEHYRVYGRGDFILYGGTYGRYAVPIIDTEKEIRLQEEFDNKQKESNK